MVFGCEHDLDLRWGVETILRSELFFSDANIQSRIADPVSFLLMPLRAIECWQSPPSTLELAKWLDKDGATTLSPTPMSAVGTVGARLAVDANGH